MSAPVSSSSPPLSSSVETDPTLDEDAQICRDLSASTPKSSTATSSATAPTGPAASSASTTPSSSEPPPAKPAAVAKLMSKVPEPTSQLPPQSSTSFFYGAANSGQRTTAREGITGYAEYGVTGTGDGVFAGAAALKGRDPKTGLEVEVFGASTQTGLQSEDQLTMARVGVSGQYGAASAEAFTARRGIGTHNDDGSIGANIGATATAVGVEGTLAEGGDSLTVGVGVGAGMAASVGLRDADQDGIYELCVKVSAGFLTLGVCAET